MLCRLEWDMFILYRSLVSKHEQEHSVQVEHNETLVTESFQYNYCICSGENITYIHKNQAFVIYPKQNLNVTDCLKDIGLD
jgi:hypothetical protein